MCIVQDESSICLLSFTEKEMHIFVQIDLINISMYELKANAQNHITLM